MGNRLTEDTNKHPDRTTYVGDPISAFDFNAEAIMPSLEQRWRNSAHSHSGLQIAGKLETHDTLNNMLEPAPDDSQAEVVTYFKNK